MIKLDFQINALLLRIDGGVGCLSDKHGQKVIIFMDFKFFLKKNSIFPLPSAIVFKFFFLNLYR